MKIKTDYIWVLKMSAHPFLNSICMKMTFVTIAVILVCVAGIFAIMDCHIAFFFLILELVSNKSKQIAYNTVT